jgi:hypothetical protein
MITYLYWIIVIAVSLGIFWLLARFVKFKIGVIFGLLAFFIGWLLYVFHYEQYFVKNLGGVMTISVPDGQVHLQATWKEDHLWIENYDPVKNVCYFTEYSKGNMLEGKVVIKNCNAVVPQAGFTRPASAE